MLAPPLDRRIFPFPWIGAVGRYDAKMCRVAIVADDVEPAFATSDRSHSTNDQTTPPITVHLDNDARADRRADVGEHEVLGMRMRAGVRSRYVAASAQSLP